MKTSIALLTLLCVAVFAFTDPRDGKEYKTIKIGELVWLAENLSYNASGSVCYDNRPANCEKYGRLYNWATAMALPSKCNGKSGDPEIDGYDSDCKTETAKHQGICPTGWHIPTANDWQKLSDYAKSETAGKKLKAKEGWHSGGNGTDAYGFSALPGGYHGKSFGGVGFLGMGTSGLWWSANPINCTDNEVDYGFNCFSCAWKLEFNYEEDFLDCYSYSSESGFSVRCIKDN
jgi:uncharacterized protein (TIGR02145 family)